MISLLQNIRIVPKRPRFLARVIKNYLLLIMGQPRLRKGQIGLTYACNCKCSHCSAEQLKDPDRPPLTTAEVKGVIDECIKLGAIAIMITGGEPTLRKDLEEIIRYINPDQAISSLLTAGRGLSKEQLLQYRRAGLGHMSISLDSPDPGRHDAIRGVPGLFQHDLELLTYGRSIGIYVQASTIVTHQNIESGEALRLAELTKEMGMDLNLLYASPVGGWTGAEDCLLSAEDWRWVKKHLLSYRHVRWEGNSSYWGQSCAAGREKIHISAYGDVIPCDFIQISFGNIREKPLRDIWFRIMRVKPFRELQDVCICSLDREFIRDYLKPLDRFEKKPVFFEQLPICRQQVNSDKT